MRKGGCTRHEVTSNRGCSSAVVLHIPGYIGHESLALKTGTCTMRYGNRSVGTVHREPRITPRRCSPEPHPCSHAVSRYLFEDLPAPACFNRTGNENQDADRAARTRDVWAHWKAARAVVSTVSYRSTASRSVTVRVGPSDAAGRTRLL